MNIESQVGRCRLFVGFSHFSVDFDFDHGISVVSITISIVFLNVVLDNCPYMCDLYRLSTSGIIRDKIAASVVSRILEKNQKILLQNFTFLQCIMRGSWQ
jgi:hypothetical protein